MIKKEVSDSTIIGKSVLYGTGLFFLVVLLTGGGHGTFLPAKLFFPYTMLSTLFTGSIDFIFIVLAFLQYPIYGLLIIFSKRYRWQNYFLIFMIALHFIVALMALNYSDPAFD